MNSRRVAHYMKWAQPFFDDVRGRVVSIEGRLFHLWHREIKDRHYAERHRGLEGFDPFTDIALDNNGCWRWSSDKAEMHALVRHYFNLRNEDGV